LNAADAIVKNDIAIVRLTERIERSSTIDWICLPVHVSIHDQEILTVVSYGHTDDQTIQEQLHVRVLQNRQSQSECQRELTDIADDAFCTISTTNSSLLGVVRSLI
jgi:hypothetical protein